jgi:DNA mismatch repair protein MutL
LNKIKLLSAEQAIKIAAGEVVERPANIIKECVENSIDAGATKITIIVHQAGKKLIKIIDNGSGMSADDAQLSVAQYATSKITTVEDLESITTFGFRGEALASINAVSNLTLTTKRAEDQTGTQIIWHFGTFQSQSLQTSQTGTTLEIAHLFDNIPARQKFLKKDETEWRAIITLFQAFCLDYRTIHFQLYDENKLHFNCPATTTIIDRAAQLFDTQLQEKGLELVHLENKLCHVSGFISNSTYYRYDRNQIFLFVNQRWVKNIDLTKAIMRGYAGTLPPQKYPAAIIFISIDRQQVDVNIHPKKEEVKFLHPKKVEQIIEQSIKATLESYCTAQIAAPKTYDAFYPLQDDHRTVANIQPAPFSFLDQPFMHHTISNIKHPSITTSSKLSTSSIESDHFDKQIINIPDAAVHAFEKTLEESKPQEIIQDKQHHLVTEEHTYTIIGQYKKTYILFEKNNNLIFVDQHAAHERILYEQFKNNFQSIATIQLIFPEFIKLSAQDIMIIAPYLNTLQEHGITAEIFSDTQLLIQSTPIHLKNQLLQETIQQIIGWITEIHDEHHERILHILHEKIHAKMACSSAIKAGDSLNMQQMEQLLQDLTKIEHRFSCPHGRPTFWVQPIDYIEKQFKRDYSQKAEQFYDFL